MDIKLVRKLDSRGKEICIFRLLNSSGSYVEVMNYGATVTAVVVPDRLGRMDNIVLAYQDLRDHFKDEHYLGSTIGRFANRISGASFSVDGRIYTLDKNDGHNCNHGGYSGFHKKIFDYAINSDNIEFCAFSADGEGGFPGNMDASVCYSFTEKNELIIDYSLVSDSRTPAGLTSHCYFNLDPAAGNILRHELTVHSDRYVETDSEFIPTGNILPVRGTAFDFSCRRPLGERINGAIKGYNTYYPCPANTTAASLYDPVSGRCLEIQTSMEGVLLYVEGCLRSPFRPYAGVCLEAQHYPDWVNREEFPGDMLSPAVSRKERIIYSFNVI